MAKHFQLICLLPAAICWSINPAEARALEGGRLTQVDREVRIAEPGASPVPGAIDGSVRNGSIRTGPDSRAEITFGDQTVVRLGDKTEFRLESNSRTFDLESGAVLIQVPARVGGTTLKARGIIVTATGATLAVECLPQAYTKLIALDGSSRLCLKRSIWAIDCVLLRTGQMIIVGPSAKTLPEAVDVDLSRFVDTCQFISEFPRLPGHARIMKAVAAQQNQKSHGAFVDTDLVIFGRGTLVSKRNAAETSQSAKAEPSGTASPSPKSDGTPHR